MLIATFVAFWVIIALAVFALAMHRGGRQNNSQVETAATRRFVAFVFALAFLFFAAVPLLIGFGNEGHARQLPGDTELPKALAGQPDKFSRTCGACHTLKATNSVGIIGPNLDELRPPATLVRTAILQGRARGAGVMPSELLQGEEVEKMAQYVAMVAGGGPPLTVR
jgi:mono/diheme cytochrome c family protein